MANERNTEAIVLEQLQQKLGENDFGYLYAQTVDKKFPRVCDLLKQAGGKPKIESLDILEKNEGKGAGKPEYIYI